MKELPVRKNIRLRDYDYSQAGYYFITICVKDKHEMLGRIAVGDGVLDVPFIQLSEYGKITDKHISSINSHYNHIEIQKYVIMPNHIHMIVVVECGTSRTPSPTNSTIPSLVSTLKRFVNKDCGFNMWQRSYHDHIIRNKEEYHRIQKYIDENPAKWESDCYFLKDI